MTASESLSVLVPAFNERDTIGELLRRVLSLPLGEVGFALQVIVCDDGSHDGTPEIVRAIAQRDDRVTLVAHDTNRGKGAAIRTALAAATGDYVIIQDADLEYDVGDYLPLLEAVRAGAQVVYGSRFARSWYPPGMQLPNFACNKLLTWMSNVLYGHGITDEATCYKVFSRSLLLSLDLRSQGFDFCPEVTAKLGLRRVTIREVPIRYQARDLAAGKKIRWTDGVRAAWVLWSLRFQRPAALPPVR